MSKNADQDILLEGGYGWVREFGDLLASEEIFRIEQHISGGLRESDPTLRYSIERIFLGFVTNALAERFVYADGKWEACQKPSTKVARDLVKLQGAIESLESSLSNLSPKARDYISAHLESLSTKEQHVPSITLGQLEETLHWPLDLLAYVALQAENLKIRGPANASLHIVVNQLANLWKEQRGKLPVSDNGRGTMQHDEFLELCQYVSMLGRNKVGEITMLEKGELASLGSATLTGIVASELKALRDEFSTQDKFIDKSK